MERNPGYGHPLRPEYLLTPVGARIASHCAPVLDGLRDADAEGVGLKKWSLAVVLALAGKRWRRFSELREELAGITARALTMTLKDLAAAGLVERTVTDVYPLATAYRLTPRGAPLVAPVRRSPPPSGCGPRAGKITSARKPPSFLKVRLPRSSSRTRARTMDRPVPLDPPPGRAVVADREHHLAVSARELDVHRVAAVLERVLEELAEDERQRRRAAARQRDGLERRLHALRVPARLCTSMARNRRATPRGRRLVQRSVSTCAPPRWRGRG